MISCQHLTHLTILLGYTVKGYVIKTVGVYIILYTILFYTILFIVWLTKGADR